MALYDCQDCSELDEDDYASCCETCNKLLCATCAAKHSTKGHTVSSDSDEET